MAKDKQETFGVILHPSEVIWFPDTNASRLSGDYGNPAKMKELQDAMIQYGWLEDDNGMIRVRKIPDQYVERAKAQRISQWEALKTNAKLNPDKAIDLVVFEEIYVKDGELRPVKYLGISGNRRGRVFLDAMIGRRKLGNPVSERVPAMVEHYDNELSFLKSQGRENEQKTLGAYPPGLLDKILLGKQMVELGSNQSDLRDVFKDGTGQKIWGIVQLNRLWPNVRIIERMSMKPGTETEPNPEYIHAPSVKFNLLPMLITRSDSVKLKAHNEKLEADGSPTIPAVTEAEIAQFFAAPKEQGNTQKVMPGDKIREWNKNSTIDVFKDVLTGIEKVETGHCAVYVQGNNPVYLNAFTKLIKEGRAEDIGKLAVKLATASDPMPVIESIRTINS